MTHFVYILHSASRNKFYIGETPNVTDRLNFHNNYLLNTNSTKAGIPWEIYHVIEVSHRSIAGKIELHIKKMKSKTYFQNLKNYNEIGNRLIEKYS